MSSLEPVVEKHEKLKPVATYRRVIAASLERVWENVLDWEHLPWLHADSFASIRLVQASRDGWRAEIVLAPAHGGMESEIEIELDRPNLCYTTRTLAGVGAGTEIVTVLQPIARASTAICVDFRLPGVPDDQIEVVGAYYLTLYARLWDQDEAMMVERQRVIERRAASLARGADPDRSPRYLGDQATLRQRLPLLVRIVEQDYRITEINGQIAVHSTVCPHMGGSLEVPVDAEGCVTCPWHGYRFDVRSGGSTDGRKLRLAPAPYVDLDRAPGEAWLRWER